MLPSYLRSNEMKSNSENQVAGAFKIKKREFDHHHEIIVKKERCFIPNEYGDRFIPRRYQTQARIDNGNSSNLYKTDPTTDILCMVSVIINSIYLFIYFVN